MLTPSLRKSALLLAMVLLALLGTAACSSSFKDERLDVTLFLRQINRANNNFEDAHEIASLPTTLRSGDVNHIQASFTILVQIDAYKRQVGELKLPSGVPELAELKTLELNSATKFQGLIQETKLTMRSGSAEEATEFLGRLAPIALDTDTQRASQIHQSTLAKYNIPDSEVSYRRPQ